MRTVLGGVAACALVLAACGGGHHVGGSVSQSDAARACTFAAACGGGGGGDCASAVIIGTAIGVGGPSDPTVLTRALDCARSSSGGCGALDACNALGHDTTYCAAHPGYSCDGDTVVLCGNAPSSEPDGAEDCAAAGMHCRTVSTGMPVETACTTGVVCDAATAHPRCEGDVLVGCASFDMEARTDCTRVYPGGLCAPSGTEVRCVPGGAVCDPTSRDVCRGNELVACTGGREQHFDCAGVGGTCMDVGGEVTCQPTGTACTETSSDRCTGNVFETCVGGNYVGTDCTSLGFTACTTPVDGAPHCS